MKIIACIPARYHASRLPGKPLLDIGGKPMIEWVYNAVNAHPKIHETFVLTDDEKIMQWANATNARAMMTSVNAKNGTERISEILPSIDADIILNVQGDEPGISSVKLDALIDTIMRPQVEIATLCTRISKEEWLFDYNKVKVVKTINNKALYFSRQAIPAHRDLAYREWMQSGQPYYLHLGVYAFTKSTFARIVQLPESSLEEAEKLEQLRWMENDFEIYVSEVEEDGSFGVDTEEDYLAIQDYMKKIPG